MKLETSKIEDLTVYYRNKEEYETIYKEIFVNKEYEFQTASKSPYILDCGSHIGLSILYFISKYPKAIIVGFEPNSVNFAILQKNIEKNKLKNVKIINAAVSSVKGKNKLYSYKYEGIPWTWGDSINYNQWGDSEDEIESEVNTVKLSDYIDKEVDFLKLDIEGSEQKVISEIENKLYLVKELVVEHHGTKFNQTENRLDLIISIIQQNFSNVDIKSMNVKDKIEKADIVRANPAIINIHAKK